MFPVILGHEGGGIVQEVGAGVKSVKPGDHVIPLYTPECGECKFCKSGKTNLCQKIRLTQGKGLMPDGTTRFSHKGKPILHYMGTSTFSEYTVMRKSRWRRSIEGAAGQGLPAGLRHHHRYRAVLNTAQGAARLHRGGFGLGGIGLSVVQGRDGQGQPHHRSRYNPDKFTMAKAWARPIASIRKTMTCRCSRRSWDHPTAASITPSSASATST